MLASTMLSAAAQALRASGRTLPAAKSLAVAGPSSSTSRVLARRTFLIVPSYKARVAVRGYATATATKTKKTTTTRTRQARIVPAAAPKKKTTAKKAKATTNSKAKPKAKPKAKAKAKAKAPKKTAAKKKPGPRKQPLSPEKKALMEKRELKKTALLHGEPKKETVTVWTTYVAERIKNEKIAGPGKDFGELMKRLSAEFKSIPASETAVSPIPPTRSIILVFILTTLHSASSRRTCRTRLPMRPPTRSGWRATLSRKFTRRTSPVIVSPGSTTSRPARSLTIACPSDPPRPLLTSSRPG